MSGEISESTKGLNTVGGGKQNKSVVQVRQKEARVFTHWFAFMNRCFM